MKIRITQADIARAAGVHNTTVSLCLRNSRLIPNATRQRIQALAQKMGYCPDPALRALVAYRNSMRTKRELGTLAFVTNWETKWGWRDLPGHASFFAGAQRKAEEIGYQLVHLWLGEEGMSQRRLSAMLLHRGINGVLLAAHRPGCDDLSGIDWSRLGAIKFGSHPHAPAVSSVSEDYGAVIRLAMKQLAAGGYCRIGFVLRRGWDDGVDQAWSTAFLAEQARLRVGDHVPMYFLRDEPGEVSDRSWPADNYDSLTLDDWLREYRPEVILGLNREIPDLLAQFGSSVPHDVAYADLGLEKPDGQIAGVQPHCERIGELAVELLADQLVQNKFGPPPAPTVTLVGGVWHSGLTLPAICGSTPDEMARATPARCA
jgi:LacI family transcriptional regulator